MSVPRLLLIPTHRTGLADALAAVLSEILTARGREARYHHLGPLCPGSSWDRSEGAVFIDPALTSEETALSLYEVAVRHADVSFLSSSVGLIDETEGIDWVPADLAALLDCPVVVVLDCKGWGSGIRLLVEAVKNRLRSVDLAGVILSGVADQDHYELLRRVSADEGVRVAGCLYGEKGLDWYSRPPGPWGQPLDVALLESVATQVDVDGLVSLAGERGFLAVRRRLSDLSGEGPVVMVAGATGFTPWSRDSVELLRSNGARVRRLDLLKDTELPAEASGLVIAGTLWPETIQDISMNTSLLRDIADRVGKGLPSVALGGGMLVMLNALQDTLGRTSEMLGVIPAEGEILWDLEEPAYVEVLATRDNVLMAKGEKLRGWVTSEVEVTRAREGWDAPAVVRGVGALEERRESYGGETLFCCPALIHFGGSRGASARFVKRCEDFQAQGSGLS